MAKNRGAANLAGLAALGALGYMLRDKQKASMGGGDESVFTGPMEVSPEYTRAVTEGLKTEGPESVGGSTRDFQSMEGVDLSTRQSRGAPRPAPKAAASAEGPDERYMAGATAPKSSPKSSSGAVPDMSQYKPRYTPPGRAPKFNEGARYPTTSLTREDVLRSTEPEYSSRMKKGGAVKVKKMASGGVTRSSASKRADGIAQKGKTRGKIY